MSRSAARFLLSKLNEFAASQAHAHPMRKFLRREEGSLIVFSLFMMVCMMLAVSTAIDVMRAEVLDTKLQNTTDRAVLAAADLEQSRPPADVVRDYFARAGLDPSLVTVTVNQTSNGNVVTASTSVDVPTMFLNMVGIDALTANSIGTATESVSNIEIALVLDNSGSMGWNNNFRLNLLKPAAKEFVDIVMADEAPAGVTAVSIIPFSTQVNAGELLDHYNASAEHDYSDCVDFAAEDFSSAQMWPTQELQRSGHFDIWTWNAPVQNSGVICPWDSSREIAPWSTDAAALKAKIDAMWAGGNTSMDVATKWGLSLLDPSAKEIVAAKVMAGDLDASVSQLPFSYSDPDAQKYLVVMSDGQNTSQYVLNDEYRSGASTVWHDPGSGNRSYYRSSTNTYYWYSNGTWNPQPEGGVSAVNISWPDLLNEMSVKYYASNYKAEAIGGDYNVYKNEMYTWVSGAEKNTRTSAICQAARDQGITVFTIGMDTYGQGDATLLDCAGVAARFYDVQSTEISTAFEAIARQIYQLRLTQ